MRWAAYLAASGISAALRLCLGGAAVLVALLLLVAGSRHDCGRDAAGAVIGVCGQQWQGHCGGLS